MAGEEATGEKSAETNHRSGDEGNRIKPKAHKIRDFQNKTGRQPRLNRETRLT